MKCRLLEKSLLINEVFVNWGEHAFRLGHTWGTCTTLEMQTRLSCFETTVNCSCLCVPYHAKPSKHAEVASALVSRILSALVCERRRQDGVKGHQANAIICFNHRVCTRCCCFCHGSSLRPEEMMKQCVSSPCPLAACCHGSLLIDWLFWCMAAGACPNASTVAATTWLRSVLIHLVACVCVYECLCGWSTTSRDPTALLKPWK